MLIGHSPTIKAAAAVELSEGEGAIVKPNGDGTFRIVARTYGSRHHAGALTALQCRGDCAHNGGRLQPGVRAMRQATTLSVSAPTTLIGGEIPLIDVSGYLSGAPGAAQRTAAELRFAFEHVGFY